MTEPKTDVQDEEYQFDDFDKVDALDESAPVSSQETQASSESSHFNGVAHKKDYRKIVVLGLIIVLVLGFAVRSLIGHFDSVKIPKEASSLPQLSETMAPTAPAPQTPTNVAGASSTVAAAVPAAVPAAIVPPAPTVSESDIDQLNTTISTQQQNMDQMQNSINTLQESVSTLNATINDLSQKLTVALSKLPEKRVKPVVQPTPIAQPPRPTYTIRALVPGRAWLQASDGQTMTVVNGDQVPAYGAVQDIDINAGQVVLTDGTIIGYNFNS